MTERVFGVSVVLVFVSLILGPPAPAQDAIDQANVKAICDKVAATYTLFSNDGRPLKLVGRSLLKWSKNTDEDVYGNVYVWTDQDVPAAVASIFKFVRPKDDVTSEFHSLATVPIRAAVGTKNVWNPRRRGITYNQLKEVANVANRKSLRLAQMRSIARRFRAEREDPNGNLTQLRFLPNPVFEYTSDVKGVLAGAIFAFVDQTDPEVWLILEARQSENGDRAWHYALARMNTRRLKVHFRDEEVFTTEYLESFDDVQSEYCLFERLQDNPAFKIEP